MLWYYHATCTMRVPLLQIGHSSASDPLDLKGEKRRATIVALSPARSVSCKCWLQGVRSDSWQLGEIGTPRLSAGYVARRIAPPTDLTQSSVSHASLVGWDEKARGDDSK